MINRIQRLETPSDALLNSHRRNTPLLQRDNEKIRAQDITAHIAQELEEIRANIPQAREREGRVSFFRANLRGVIEHMQTVVRNPQQVSEDLAHELRQINANLSSACNWQNVADTVENAVDVIEGGMQNVGQSLTVISNQLRRTSMRCCLFQPFIPALAEEENIPLINSLSN